jgi:hypothetical protein
MSHTTPSPAQASTDPVPLHFPVAHELLGQAHIAAWAFAPHHQSDLLPALWLFCLPGGTYRGLAYYDRQVPGFAPYAYSMARHLAGQGIGSVVIDNLGTGESHCAVPGEHLTAELLASVSQQVVQQLRERLVVGTLVSGLAPIQEESLWLAGVGHSMGSFLLTHLQGRFHPLDAVVQLGMPYQHENVAALMASFGEEGTFEQMLAQLRQHAGDTELLQKMREMSRPLFYSREVPQALIEADERDATAVPLGLFQDVYTEWHQTAALATQISTPVYLGFGEVELPAPRAEVASYGAALSITLFVLAKAPHCANFAPNRRLLWDDLAAWVRAKAVHTRPPLNRTLGTPAC